jgi:hypothetical protein
MIAPRPWLGISTRDWFINSATLAYRGRLAGVKMGRVARRRRFVSWDVSP